MKKALALLLACLLMVSVFAACGQEEKLQLFCCFHLLRGRDLGRECRRVRRERR